MPVTVELIRQGRVALQTYSDPLTMPHLDALQQQMNRDIFPGAAGKVHILSDFRQVRHLPSMILSRGAFMLNNAHPNMGTIVAVIADPFIYRMARAFASLTARKPFRVARSFEEGIGAIDDLLAKEDSQRKE